MHINFSLGEINRHRNLLLHIEKEMERCLKELEKRQALLVHAEVGNVSA